MTVLSKMRCSQLWADNTKRYVYGYKLGENKLPDLTELENNCKITFGPKNKEVKFERPMTRKLNVFHEKTAPFMADRNDEATIVAGCCYRVLRGTNKPDESINDFISFSRKWIKNNFIPLPADTDVSYENFRSKCQLPEWRKAEYDVAWQDVKVRLEGMTLKRKDLVVKSFIKEESYPTYKHPRMINARNDRYKVCIGPYIQAISESVFMKPYFIKTVPVESRANYIHQYLGNCGCVFESDFTSYESSHNPTVMREVEIWFYDYMCQRLPTRETFSYLIDFLTTDNIINLNEISMVLRGKRMSGEMNTSLGNSIMNKLLCEYAAYRQNIKIKSVHEGDDGLIGFDVGCDIKQYERDINALGYQIKLIKHNTVGEASFCGLVFSENGHCIREPIDTLVNFDVCRQKYIGCNPKTMNTLLRCKAMSLLYECTHCPLLKSFACYILKNTIHDQETFENKFLDNYKARYNLFLDKNKLNEMNEKVKNSLEEIKQIMIPFETRFFFEKKYNIPIGAQFYLENLFNKQTKLVNFSDPVLNAIIPQKYFEHGLRYISELPYKVRTESHQDAVKIISQLPGMVRRGMTFKKKVLNENFN